MYVSLGVAQSLACFNCMSALYTFCFTAWWCLFLLCSPVAAQEPLPFWEEVQELQRQKDWVWDRSRKTVVFTGSSSIKLWKDLEASFPQYQIINTGFGGSQASDLARYIEPLILRYNPVKVFIYEGDNDISAGKSPRAILHTFKYIIAYLHERRPALQIVLIATKPSMARWSLRRRYKRLNRKLHRLAAAKSGVYFADVWTPMFRKRALRSDLFREDGLHLNDKGYELWYELLKSYAEPNGLHAP